MEREIRRVETEWKSIVQEEITSSREGVDWVVVLQRNIPWLLEEMLGISTWVAENRNGCIAIGTVVANVSQARVRPCRASTGIQ
jgi:hypothetical protein